MPRLQARSKHGAASLPVLLAASPATPSTSPPGRDDAAAEEPQLPSNSPQTALQLRRNNAVLERLITALITSLRY